MFKKIRTVQTQQNFHDDSMIPFVFIDLLAPIRRIWIHITSNYYKQRIKQCYKFDTENKGQAIGCKLNCTKNAPCTTKLDYSYANTNNNLNRGFSML